jgi:hypothetical protein
MCFYNNNKQKGVKVAKTAIKVYKALDILSRKAGTTKLVSPYYHAVEWKKGVVKTSSVAKSTTRIPYILNRGLHSAKTLTEARQHSRKVFTAVIPKGSLYWENNKEYISSALKLISGIPLK